MKEEKNDDKRRMLFEEIPIAQAAMKLAIPSICSALVSLVYNLSDTFFVGKLNDPYQNAAVALAAPLMMISNGLIHLFGTGSTSLISRKLGQRDGQGARKASAFGLYGALASSALFSLGILLGRESVLALLGATPELMELTYQYVFFTVILGTAPTVLHSVLAGMLRAEGATLPASVGIISGCAMNILLDPLFILPLGLGLGAKGAALATLLSNVFSCAFFLIYLYRKRTETIISMAPKHFSLEKQTVYGVLQVGVPFAVQNGVNVLSQMLMNKLSAGVGALAVAAMGVATKLHNMPVQIMIGFASGIIPLIGYNMAGGNRTRARACLVFSLRTVLPVMIAAAALFCLFSEELVRFFIEDSEIVRYGGWLLRVKSAALPLFYLDNLATSFFQAVGKGRRALYYAILRKVILEIPAMFLLNALWPFYGLPFAVLLSEAVMAGLAIADLKGIFRMAGEDTKVSRE